MMKTKITLLLLLLVQITFGQDRTDYLSNNSIDLRKNSPVITETDFNIIGFGALHGSAKTYDAELSLLSSLVEKNDLDYYIIETNYSQAFYFQEYLNTGDEKLLKELTLSFQTMVAQEGTIETFNHWKNIRALNLKHPNQPIKVIGCDVVNEYRFPIKHILHLTKDDHTWKARQKLKELSNQKELDFSMWDKEINSIIKPFVQDYLTNKEKYKELITDIKIFDHIINNINHNFEDKREREKIVFENYMFLHQKLNLSDKKQFAKYGYFHIQKEREGNYPSFFTRLIENEVYERNKVITIMGYLTDSKVLWDKKYDKNGNYKNYTTKAGFGISDYWREYFKGIKNLKKSKLSDLTMFKLNQDNSPYSIGTDLVEIKMFLKDYNKTKLKGKNTLLFIDYAILISESKEQVPIEEMK
ncbi:hypothetical protein DNU06_16020 [Putridiphycobacter roseus]|uniref:Erythromycin esterase family protein n=1 Tax=Putridiphycobacter roseus TaxID=2219161 RepID=A0A2W1N9E8_9FLAO|nr:erythromycin esterase family protein [Putridiphycobacter roseus]PZE15885.1 hypothetical protein DNU06_16020 [Putridiphycobacter roseus]